MPTADPTRREVLVRQLASAALAPAALGAAAFVGAAPAHAGTKDKGRSFHLNFSLHQKSQVGFQIRFTADQNTREMAVQLQQFTRLSTGTGWRPMNMIVKYAGDVNHQSAYWLLRNQYRLAVGLTAGYTFDIKVFARPLNEKNHVVGPSTIVARRSGHT